MRLLVFLHGTVLMHSAALDRRREERVEQVRRGDLTLDDYGAYVPVGNAVAKLRSWYEQGARIDYLSSHRSAAEVAADEAVLRNYRFPRGRVLWRARGEGYGELAGRELPDILVEDDCESIGADEITYRQIAPELRASIKSIIVPEFGGIDHLPDSLEELLAYSGE